jgi:hypothetical protein
MNFQISKQFLNMLTTRAQSVVIYTHHVAIMHVIIYEKTMNMMCAKF